MSILFKGQNQLPKLSKVGNLVAFNNKKLQLNEVFDFVDAHLRKIFNFEQLL